MLTGDTKRVAEQVAAELGVDEVRSELLPRRQGHGGRKAPLRRKGPHEKLAFVGDGINDAPVLTRADIGIAMGAMGSDAAIEAADVVLMDDDPKQIVKAIRISRKCIGIVKQNIVFSLIVKFGCLALVAAGIADMWAAIFADVGVMILAVLNAIRALRYKGIIFRHRNRAVPIRGPRGFSFCGFLLFSVPSAVQEDGGTGKGAEWRRQRRRRQQQGSASASLSRTGAGDAVGGVGAGVGVGAAVGTGDGDGEGEGVTCASSARRSLRVILRVVGHERAVIGERVMHGFGSEA